MACRICKSSSNVEADGRCRSCRAAKTATDMGTSYGNRRGAGLNPNSVNVWRQLKKLKCNSKK